MNAICEYDGDMPLHRAVREGFAEIVRCLCVAVCCSVVLSSMTATYCCKMSQCAIVEYDGNILLQCVAVCCSVLQ